MADSNAKRNPELTAEPGSGPNAGLSTEPEAAPNAEEVVAAVSWSVRLQRSLPLLAVVAVTLLLALGLWRMLYTPPVKIALTSGVEGIALRELAKELGDDYQIEIIELGSDELFDRALDELSRESSAFDVIMIDDPWLPALLGTDENAPRLAEIRLDDAEREDLARQVFDSCLSVCRQPGAATSGPGRDVYYALPFSGNTQLFCMREPGGSPREAVTVSQKPRFDSWKAMIAEMTRNEQALRYFVRVGSGNGVLADFLPVLWEFAPNAFGRNTMALLEENGRAESAFAQLIQMGRKNFGLMSVDDFDLAARMLSPGRTASASIVWAAWAMTLTTMTEDLEAVQDLTFMPVPGEKPVLGAWLLVVPGNSPNADSALKFVKRATRKEALASAARHGNPPPRRDLLREEKLVEAFPTFPLQYEALENARPRPRTPQWREIERRVGSRLSLLYARQAAGRDAIVQARQAVEQTNEILRDLGVAEGAQHESLSAGAVNPQR